MIIQIITMPNGKQLLFLGLKVWQRWSGKEKEWEPFDQKILEHTPIPRNAVVEQKEV